MQKCNIRIGLYLYQHSIAKLLYNLKIAHLGLPAHTCVKISFIGLYGV